MKAALFRIHLGSAHYPYDALGKAHVTKRMAGHGLAAYDRGPRFEPTTKRQNAAGLRLAHDASDKAFAADIDFNAAGTVILESAQYLEDGDLI